jgi:hypothetical protein
MHNRSLLRPVLLALALMPAMAFAQSAPADPPHSSVSIYHVAPGKHADFLRWMAVREASDKEAGLPATMWYAHLNGDSWDYVAVGPKLTDEQDKKSEEMAKKKGLTTGMAASLEFRSFINSHTDTDTIGPVSAQSLVDKLAKK